MFVICVLTDIVQEMNIKFKMVISWDGLNCECEIKLQMFFITNASIFVIINLVVSTEILVILTEIGQTDFIVVVNVEINRFRFDEVLSQYLVQDNPCFGC